MDTFEKREGFRIISACPLYQVSSKTGWWWNLKCGQTIGNKTLPNELFSLCTRACLSIHSSCKSVIYIDEPELSIHTEQNRNWRLSWYAQLWILFKTYLKIKIDLKDGYLFKTRSGLQFLRLEEINIKLWRKFWYHRCQQKEINFF